MNKSIFRVSKMDCVAEEQLVRMKLGSSKEIEALLFDLAGRKLTVIHNGPVEPITQSLSELHLDSSLLETEDTDITQLIDPPPNDRRLLIAVLLINATFFVLEIFTGFMARSMGLVADSLDMLADAIVYGLALYAVGQATVVQKRIARISGYFQLALAASGLFEVIRRFISPEPTPNFWVMMGVSFGALIGNSASLWLLNRSQSQQAHMQASQIFTSNDVIANVGVIVAGGLVYFTGLALPDLLIGLIVFVLVARGSFRIFQLSK